MAPSNEALCLLLQFPFQAVMGQEGEICTAYVSVGSAKWREACFRSCSCHLNIHIHPIEVIGTPTPSQILLLCYPGVQHVGNTKHQ